MFPPIVHGFTGSPTTAQSLVLDPSGSDRGEAPASLGCGGRGGAHGEDVDDGVVEDVGSSLAAAGVEVTTAETIDVDGTDVVVFTVTDPANGTESRLHFFVADGRTWELACQMNDEGRTTIEPACEELLNTLAIAT